MIAYGNDAIVGEAIREKVREFKNLTREDFFVISKLCGTQHRMHFVNKCCHSSVERLGLDYVDLYLMYSPVALKHRRKRSFNTVMLNIADDNINPKEAWLGLEKCYQEGICRSIGVSNFNEHQLNALILEEFIVPAVNQIECSVGFNQKSLRQFCQQQEILVMGHSPLGKQKLTFLTNESVQQIALSFGKTPAQVDGGVVPIVKSSDYSRQQENLGIFDFKLTDQQIEDVDALTGKERACKMDYLAGAKHFPFTESVQLSIFQNINIQHR